MQDSSSGNASAPMNGSEVYKVSIDQLIVADRKIASIREPDAIPSSTKRQLA